MTMCEAGAKFRSRAGSRNGVGSIEAIGETVKYVFIKKNSSFSVKQIFD